MSRSRSGTRFRTEFVRRGSMTRTSYGFKAIKLFGVWQSGIIWGTKISRSTMPQKNLSPALVAFVSFLRLLQPMQNWSPKRDMKKSPQTELPLEPNSRDAKRSAYGPCRWGLHKKIVFFNVRTNVSHCAKTSKSCLSLMANDDMSCGLVTFNCGAFAAPTLSNSSGS
jgi:hypothetical protein